MEMIRSWPRKFIKKCDIELLFENSPADYSLVLKRAVRAGLLVQVKRGLYFVDNGTNQFDEFELSLLLRSPSFVSLESALSYHGWIPEAVYTTTCVSSKKGTREYVTPFGRFTYRRINEGGFYDGVDQIKKEDGWVFIASPMRALADLIYTTKKRWKNLDELSRDLRIEKEDIIDSDEKVLELLIRSYPSEWVKDQLKIFSKEISKH